MDLLSMVSMATKRRSDYMQQAKTLAKRYPSQPALEKRMREESIGLVKGLRDKLMRWEEYERSLLDKTLTSALASVIIGVNDQKVNEHLESAWPIIVGDLLPPLTQFLAETKTYLDNGTLRLGDQTQDFADGLDDVIPGAVDLETDELGDISPEEDGRLEASQGRAHGKDWGSLATRVARYIASATFAFVALGAFMVARTLGNKEMRRVDRHDKSVCPDCRSYGEAGWQPIGSLPMPGKGCQCYDRCRCRIEYR
jgi:hypothetical protein